MQASPTERPPREPGWAGGWVMARALLAGGLLGVAGFSMAGAAAATPAASKAAVKAAAAETAPPAASTLTQVRAHGAVRCGGVERPGLAEADGRGGWRGLEVDVCRAVAIAVLGSAASFEFAGYGSPDEFARVAQGRDDVFFLTGREIALHRLAGAIVPGPAVYIASQAVMVPGDSPVRRLSDLQGQSICFLIGDPAESSLEEYFESRQLDWLRHPYSESGEMNDAYAVRRCHALAGDAAVLAQTRLGSAVAKMQNRILPEPLSSHPILVATGVRDARWSAIVGWVVETLIAAARPERKWFAGGARAMPVEAEALGLSSGWQLRLSRDLGSHADIFRRNLGADSPYRLDPGLNASQDQGGILIGPYVE